jgi:hypothetical protein
MTAVDARRVAAALVLVAAVAGACVHYGTLADDQRPYPTDEEVAGAYDSYVGETVYVWATVERAADEGVVVSTDYLELRVRGPVAGVAPGDVLQVYGTLRPGHEVTPERVVRSERTDRAWMFGVSGVAGVLALAALFRRWRVDWRTLRLEPRAEVTEDA